MIYMISKITKNRQKSLNYFKKHQKMKSKIMLTLFESHFPLNENKNVSPLVYVVEDQKSIIQRNFYLN